MTVGHLSHSNDSQGEGRSSMGFRLRYQSRESKVSSYFEGSGGQRLQEDKYLVFQ